MNASNQIHLLVVIIMSLNGVIYCSRTEEPKPEMTPEQVRITLWNFWHLFGSGPSAPTAVPAPILPIFAKRQPKKLSSSGSQENQGRPALESLDSDSARSSDNPSGHDEKKRRVSLNSILSRSVQESMVQPDVNKFSELISTGIFAAQEHTDAQVEVISNALDVTLADLPGDENKRNFLLQQVFGEPICYLAAAVGRTDLVIKFNLVNQTDKLGMTPLHAAAHAGNIGAVQALLDAQADVNVQDASGRAPIHMAAEKGHVPVMQVLLNYNKGFFKNLFSQCVQTNVVVQDSDGNNALHYGVDNNHLPLVILLAAYPALLDVQNKKAYTPLHRAISKANKIIKDPASDLAIQQATIQTNIAIIQELVRQGASQKIAASGYMPRAWCQAFIEAPTMYDKGNLVTILALLK